MSDPTLSSNSPNGPKSDNPAAAADDLMHEDPLLQSGSFIEPTFEDEKPARNGDVQSPNPREMAAEQKSEPSSAQSHRPLKSPSVPERPDWLPGGWGFDFRIRSSGVSAGTYDRYYIDPATNRRFRSKKEVEHYLETGMLKRPASDTAENGPMSSSKSQKGKKSTSAEWSFDQMNVPDQVKWSLIETCKLCIDNTCTIDTCKDTWCAFNGSEMVPESTTRVWSAHYFLAANK